MNPTVPTTQGVTAPSRTADRQIPRTSGANAASRWAASARTMPKGVPPAAFTQVLAQASQARQATQGRSSESAASRGLPTQGLSTQGLPNQQAQLQALQAILGDGTPEGTPSVFGNGQTSQNDLLQFLVQRLSAIQAGQAPAATPAPAQAAP